MTRYLKNKAARVVGTTMAVMSVFVGCSERAWLDRSNSDHENEKEGFVISLTIDPGSENLPSKSRYQGSETDVRDCFVLAFRTSDGRLVDSGYSESACVSLRLLKGYTYDIYALANFGDISPKVLPSMLQESMESLRIPFPDVETYASGLPAAGVLQNVDIGTQEGISISLNRLVSKFEVFFDDPDSEYDVVMARIAQAASDCTPFSPGNSKASASVEGDSASWTELSQVNSADGGSITLYVPMNMRGNLLSGVTDRRLKSLYDVPDEESSLCTYLEVIATAPGGDVVYRILLGKDLEGSYNNFDIGAGEFTQVRIRSSRNDVMDAGMRWTQGGIFDGVVVKIAAGGTVKVRFNDDDSQIASAVNTTQNDRWFRIMSPWPVSRMRGAFAANREGFECNRTGLLAVAYIPTSSEMDWLNSYDYNYGLFRECEALVSVACANWHTERIRTFMNMFRGCKSLQTPDVSGWNTSSVESLSSMFESCESMVEGPDMSRWNDDKISNMCGMFMNCLSMVTPPNLTGWDTPSLTSLFYTFRACRSLKEAPDVSQLNTSKVGTIRGIFSECRAMATTPDVSLWDTSSLTNMKMAFSECWKMPDVPDVSCWNTSKVTDFSQAFWQCRSMNGTPDVSDWDTSLATSFEGTFGGCSKMIEAPDVSNWKTSSCTSVKMMFSQNSMMVDAPDLSRWNDAGSSTMLINNTANMFQDCSSMSSVPDFSRWTITGLKNLNRMFMNCSKMEGNLDLSGWNTAAVTDWAYFLYGCSKVHSLAGVMDMSSAVAATEAFAFSTNISTDNPVNNVRVQGFGRQADIKGAMIGHSGNESGIFSGCHWGASSTYATAEESRGFLLSMLNSLYDRAAAGYPLMEIRLSEISYRCLTAEQIASAEAKGYTLYAPGAQSTDLSKVPVRVNMVLPSGMSMTKSSYEEDEKEVHSSFVLCYDSSGKKQFHAVSSLSEGVTFLLTPSESYSFKAILNCGPLVECAEMATLGTLSALRIGCPDVTTFSNGLPAVASKEGVLIPEVGSDGFKITLNAFWLVSSIILRCSDPEDAFTIKSVCLRQAASDFTPFNPGASKPSGLTDGDSLSKAELATLNADGEAILYAPVNRNLPSEAPSMVTYVEVTATSFDGVDVEYRLPFEAKAGVKMSISLVMHARDRLDESLVKR